MADRKYNILKAVSWYTVGNILIKGVGFFVLPIFTRMMSTHEYGIYGVYTSYLTIFETVILLGLSATIAVARYAKEVEYESYVSTILVIPVALAVGCLGIVNVLLPVIGELLSMDALLWNCLIISAGTGSVCNIIGAKLVLEGKYRLYMAYSGLHTVGNVAISLVLCYTVFKTHDTHLARVFGSTAVSVICAFFLLAATKTRIKVKMLNIKYGLAWGIPLLFHTVATVVHTQSDRILIRYMDSYAAAGIYAVATTIVAIPMVIQQSFAQAWTPWFYDKLDKSEYGQIRWLNNRYILLFAAIIAAFMLVSPDVIHIFTEQSYWPAVYCLIPLTIGAFLETLYSIPVSVEYYNKKTSFIMIATIISVGINILLDILFIRLFGYPGAAYATAISKLILFLLHYRFSRKLDQNSLFSNRIVILMLASLAAVDAVTVFTIDLYVIRYAILFCILVPFGWYVINNRKELLSRFRSN